ncbi:hypothetical protein V8E55_005333 [Tylopilus felleus]
MAELLKSKGVGFSDFPLNEDPELDLVAFNDLSLVDGWTFTLRVEGILEIVLYKEDDTVVGVELVYLMSNAEDSPRIVHGHKTDTPTKISVSEKERIVAAFVGIDESENKMKSLRFTKSNIDDGSVSTEGIVAPGSGNLKYSAAFGEISAFRGTKVRGDGGRLVTLGVQTRFYGPAIHHQRQYKPVRGWLPTPVQGNQFDIQFA